MFSHHFDQTILRAYDIRGIVGTTLFAKDAYAIGVGFAHCVRQKLESASPRIAVGYDGRLSSPELSKALIEGLVAGGADVITIGMGPTPMLYFADIMLDCEGAIQITGSHNPKDYNGFKMVCNHRSFFADDIQNLGAILAEGVNLPAAGTATSQDVMPDYMAKLASESQPLDGSFIWDTGNGAAGPAVSELITHLTGEHELLFGEVDGTFPNHHPDPVDPHTLTFLREAVAKMGALCGLGFDGDGDRLGVIDAKGRLVPGDILTAFIGVEFLSRCPGETILFDVKSSQAAMSIIEKAGGKPRLWKTGHSHMKSQMAEINCQLAGEMSGHIFIKDGYYGFDDALYVAIRVLRTMAKTGQSITEFMDKLPDVHASPECRVMCDDKIKFTIMDQLHHFASDSLADKDVITIDGIRVQDESGWWLIRASNTEACLVVRAEGRDEASLAHKISEVKEALAQQNIIWDGPTA